MILGGLQKLTLIDFPGKIAATVFTVGCNFFCPFCHNPELVAMGWERGSVSEKELFDFLKKRQGKLDGVCITGGEPTIQKDLIEFIRKIKAMGFLVKLDSNGTRPDVLKKLFQEKLVDFVAMDIKSSLENYAKVCGEKVDLERIKLSVDLIRNSGVDYEFRTTVVPTLHHYSDFKKIGQWLKGSKKYALQAYRDGKILEEKFRQKFKRPGVDLKRVKKELERYFEKVEVR